MPRKTPSQTGAAWLRGSGEKPVAVTLTPELHEAAGVLAARLGIRGRAELGRALYRWAASITNGGNDLGRIRKILGTAIDSVESVE